MASQAALLLLYLEETQLDIICFVCGKYRCASSYFHIKEWHRLRHNYTNETSKGMVAKQSKVAKAVCCTMCMAFITEILWEVDVAVSAISPVYGEVLVAVMSNTIRMNK